MLLKESLYKEIMTENFPNIGKDMDIQTHIGQRSQIKFNPKVSLRYIIIKKSKIKERILKAAKKEACHIQEYSNKPIAEFLGRKLADQESEMIYSNY